MRAASAIETAYSHPAGWADVDHGTRLARKVPAGTEAATTPATRHQRARRLRLSSAAPQKTSPIAASTTASASA